MAFLDTYERTQLQAISDVTYCNPFLPEYPERQRVVMGDDFLESQALWNMRGDNIDAPLVEPATIAARVEPLVDTLRKRLTKGAIVDDSAFSLYEDAVLYLLFYRYESLWRDYTHLGSQIGHLPILFRLFR